MVEFNREFYTNKIDSLAAEFKRSARKNEDWLSNVGNMFQSRVYKESVLDDVEFVFKNCDSVHQLSPLSIVDFGCGSGVTTGILAGLGFGVTGLEYSGRWVDGPQGEDLITKQLDQYKKSHEIVLRNFSLENLRFSYYTGSDFFSELKPVYVTMFAVWEHLDEGTRDDLVNFFNSQRDLEKIFITKLPRRFSWQENLARVLKIESHSNIYTLEKFKSEISRLDYSLSKYEISELFINHPNYLANWVFPLTNPIKSIGLDQLLKLFMHDFRFMLTRR